MTNDKLPVWFWVIAVVALLWNLMGLFAFISDTFLMDAETMAATYTSEQLALVQSLPSWTKIFYGLATIGGTLGSIALLLRKSWAAPLFLLSLLGVVVQQAHSWFMTNSIELFGQGAGLIFPLVILTIAIFLVWYSRKAIAMRWIN